MVFSVELDSPNFISRNSNTIKALVLRSEVGSAKDIIDNFLHPKSEQSSHYLIDEKGGLFQLVPEDKAALCTGFSFWRNIENLDLHAISITLVTNNPEIYSPAQIKTLAEFANEKIKTYQIPQQNIVSACDVNFVLYQDFGFPWQELAKNGIGLWVDEKQNSINEKPLIEALTEIGYNINVQNFRMAIIAFQKHFLPHHLSGEEDEITTKRANEIRNIFNK